ncbi:MAG: ribbon-helix-helix protein, CopG family [Cocleimonas sp.]|nr:ribbon-helix-helix protein, CopG family [Cocleimonas sp.]
MRTIQMTLDEELIEQVDFLVKENKTTRSAFTREALTRTIKYYQQLKLEKKQQQGYLKYAVSNDEFGDWENEQDWGQE